MSKKAWLLSVLLALALVVIPLQRILAAPTSAEELMNLGMSPELATKIVTIVNTLASPFPNNTYVTFRNAANSANISVLKVDASDETWLNADTGDTINLGVAGTAELSVGNDSLTFSGAAGTLAFGATSGAFGIAGTTEATLTNDQLAFSGAAFEFVPGATSLTFKNNADNASNLAITDAGVVTARAGLVATAGGVTATAGNVAITAGDLTFAAASANVIPGATSLLFRNNANNATNLSIADAGPMVFRSTFIGTGTATIGWAVVAGANTACTTTCTTPCVFGVNTAATEADIVDCADATADECLCAGAS